MNTVASARDSRIDQGFGVEVGAQGVAVIVADTAGFGGEPRVQRKRIGRRVYA